MDKCPRCYNSEIDEKDNYCKICGTNLRGEAAAGTTALEKVIEDARRRMTKKQTPTSPQRRSLQ